MNYNPNLIGTTSGYREMATILLFIQKLIKLAS